MDNEVYHQKLLVFAYYHQISGWQLQADYNGSLKNFVHETSCIHNHTRPIYKGRVILILDQKKKGKNSTVTLHDKLKLKTQKLRNQIK